MLNTNKIEGIRKLNNFTQNEFAEILEISANTYQNLLKSRDFRVSTIEKICEKFGVTASYLFDEDKLYSESGSIGNVSEPKESYGLKKENQLLKARVNDLETIIDLMKKQKQS